MSNGFLIAARADAELAAQLAEGFELTLMHEDPFEAVIERIKGAPNIGILLTHEAAQDEAFVFLLRRLADALPGAQLIVAEGVRELFAFLPAGWPELALSEARRRAELSAARRAGPLPPTEHQQPEQAQQQENVDGALREEQSEADKPEEAAPSEDALSDIEPSGGEGAAQEKAAETEIAPQGDAFADGAPAPEMPPAVEPPTLAQEPEPAPVPAMPPSVSAPQAPPMAPPAPASPPRASEDARDDDHVLARKRSAPTAVGASRQAGAAPSAPADATAFAPRKLRRGEAELVRIAIHQPKDLNAVIKAARKADPRAAAFAPHSMGIGEVALGASVGVALEVRGAACDGALQRRTWSGDPLDFSFAVEADADVKQIVILARVFVNDAQIGVLAFTRGVTGPKAKPLSDGERVRLKRHKRVFLSYSSADRETVSAIATAYEMAGVAHFWDRASLKSGEAWHPRLRREIDRCDLFHLCWSKSAASSEWVEKEATHALGLRRRKKKPDITVQMLDGPPWAQHPDSLDSINFDDFVRAAIVGYARGDG